jgi:hypothetical protein
MCWKADLNKTETRYGELNLRARPIVVDGLFFTFSTNAGLEIVAGGVKATSQSYQIEGPTADNDFDLVTQYEEAKVTEGLRIIDNNLIIISDGAMSLVLERHVGAIPIANKEPTEKK